VRVGVRAEPEIVQDLAELVADDREVARAAITLMLALRENPWLGERLRRRANLRRIEDCRRIRFDREGWDGKPRYRLVYRNEPEDGAPAVARIWAVGPRARLAAYARAAARMARAEARERRRPG